MGRLKINEKRPGSAHCLKFSVDRDSNSRALKFLDLMSLRHTFWQRAAELAEAAVLERLVPVHLPHQLRVPEPTYRTDHKSKKMGGRIISVDSSAPSILRSGFKSHTAHHHLSFLLSNFVLNLFVIEFRKGRK